jgi:hypothetical protein
VHWNHLGGAKAPKSSNFDWFAPWTPTCKISSRGNTNMKTLLIGLVFGLALSAQPYAGRGGSGFGHGYGPAAAADNFAARIAFGERTGRLTPREARRLWEMERHLQREIGRASRFGFSRGERERIARLSAQLDAAIARQMRDGDRRWR